MRRTVWAPRAERAELVLEDGARLAMERAGDGGFQLESARLVPSLRYRVSLDGGPPLPDPRSSFQPDGVEGTSELVDEEFAWTDAGWSAPPLRDAQPHRSPTLPALTPAARPHERFFRSWYRTSCAEAWR